MVAHPQVHVQVAGGPPRRPPAPRPGRRSVDPSSTPAGTSTTKDRSSRRRPSPRQSGHGRRDLLADAAAARAGRGRHHLAQDRLADPADLARTLAGAAGDRGGPGPGAGAGAGRAGLRQPHGQLVLDAEHGLGELQGQGRLGVLSLAGTASGVLAPLPPMPAAAPEEGVEEVAQPAAAEAGERIARPRRPLLPRARRPAPNMSYWRRRSGSRRVS